MTLAMNNIMLLKCFENLKAMKSKNIEIILFSYHGKPHTSTHSQKSSLRLLLKKHFELCAIIPHDYVFVLMSLIHQIQLKYYKVKKFHV